MTYQGLAAPTDLFADLELIGWSPPTIAPPPHDAIDWSRPDESTGERFTLRDYTVAGAIVQPPAGTASRGTWSDAERSTHLAALTRVLDRHGSVVVDDPAALVRAPAPPPPPTASLATAPAPPPAAAAAGGRPDPSATVLVTAPIKPSLAPRAEDALVALGVAVVFENQGRVRTERYRGSSFQTTVTQLHVGAIAAPGQLDAVVAALTGLGLGRDLAFAEVDAAAPAPAPAPGAPSEPADVDDDDEVMVSRRDGLACVVALADPRMTDAVSGVIRSLGLVDAWLTPATRIEVSRYRGQRSERAVPSIRVEAWVPEPHARLVMNHLADAARLRVEDTTRLWIEPPTTTDHRIDEVERTDTIEPSPARDPAPNPARADAMPAPASPDSPTVAPVGA